MNAAIYEKAMASLKEALLAGGGYENGDLPGWAYAGGIPLFSFPLEKTVDKVGTYALCAFRSSERSSADNGCKAEDVTIELDLVTNRSPRNAWALDAMASAESLLEAAGWRVDLASVERDQSLKKTVAIYDCRKVFSDGG